jgi:hypothetical protein
VAFENLTLGGNTKLVNPLAGLAFDLEGTDSHQLAIPPFRKLASQELAAQAVELYWMALCRDVNFLDYASHPLTQKVIFAQGRQRTNQRHGHPADLVSRVYRRGCDRTLCLAVSA